MRNSWCHLDAFRQVIESDNEKGEENTKHFHIVAVILNRDLLGKGKCFRILKEDNVKVVFVNSFLSSLFCLCLCRYDQES